MPETVYLNISLHAVRWPSFHYREDCYQQSNARRLTLTRENAESAGFQACEHCTSARESLKRAARRRAAARFERSA